MYYGKGIHCSLEEQNLHLLLAVVLPRGLQAAPREGGTFRTRIGSAVGPAEPAAVQAVCLSAACFALAHQLLLVQLLRRRRRTWRALRRTFRRSW